MISIISQLEFQISSLEFLVNSFFKQRHDRPGLVIYIHSGIKDLKEYREALNFIKDAC